MKKVLSFLLAVSFILGMLVLALPVQAAPKCDGGSSCPSNGYSDVSGPSNWAHAGIDYCIDAGYMGSTSTKALTFEPKTLVSRAMVASIMYRIAGSPSGVSYNASFTDVHSGKWFTTAIEWAAQNGLASGKGNGKFDPNGNVTRQELAVFMYKLADFMGIDVSGKNDLASYTDAAKVPSWAKIYVQWAVDAKLISGKASGGKTYLAPADNATRAEFASIVMNYGTLEPSGQTVLDYESFGIASSSIINDYPVKNWSAAAADDNEFYSGRLIVQASSPIDIKQFNPTTYIIGPDNLYLIQFSTSGNAAEAFRILSNMPEVIYVEPDGYLGSGADQQVSAESKSWGVSAIGADKLAAYTATVTSSSITVAVVDSGVSNHTFLTGRILSSGYDFVDNDNTPNDLNSHGTHVAGTVVDCTPGLKVNILPVRVLDESGSGYTSTVGAGIIYAANHGAKVINLSLGGDHSSYIDSAVQYAISKGVCVVVAAGNDYGNTAAHCPAHINEAIVVGAVDSNLQKADFSNVGSSLDVVCPGVNIVSCVPGGSYKSFNGTSMATPHAAAAVAMLRLLYPSKSPSEIEALLRSHTTDLGQAGWDTYYGAGLPNLAQFVPAPVIKPSSISLNKTSMSLVVGTSGSLTATVSPSNAADKSVTWSSSNSSVASVSSSGYVTAKSVGTTTITAKTVNGLTASCSVTVAAVAISDVSLYSVPFKTSYYIGEQLDTYGLQLKIYYNDGSTSFVSSGFSCSPTSFSSSGTKYITVSYGGYSSSFAVFVSAPTITLSSYSASKTMDCWDSYWNTTRGVPLWKLYLPSVTTTPGGGSVSWSLVSGQGYMTTDYIAAQQPGRYVARATYTYCGYTYTADYTVTLSIYKTPTAVNNLRSGPSQNYSILTTVPTGATVYITEVVWDASMYDSQRQYYLWGKTSYNGYSGWIVIS